MRLLVLAILSAASAVGAQPLGEAELRVGYGVAVRGGDAMSSTALSPLTLTAIGAVAVREQPAAAAFGGIVVEALERTSVGATAGLRVRPGDAAIRLAAGGTWMFAPATLWGASASAGTCHAVARGIGLCADLVINAYFAGTAVGPDETITEVQLGIGVAFDAY